MTLRRRSTLVLAQILALSVFATVGCSQDDHGAEAANTDPAAAQAVTDTDPTAFTKDDQAELDEVGVAKDEAVVDEGAPVVTVEGEGDDAFEVDVPPAPGEPEPETNPIADDVDDDTGLEPVFADEDAAPPAANETGNDDADASGDDGADEDTDLATQSVRLGTSSLHPLAETTKTVAAGKTYKCRKATPGRRCVCKGSPVNCQLPNTQRGFRNRYIPQAESDRIAKADGHADAQKKIEKELGRWLTQAPTPLYDGHGRLRAETISGQCFEYTDGLAGTKEVGGTCVRINFGQMKTMDADGAGGAKTYVYAWSVTANGAAASSWIRLASVVHDDSLKKMGVARNPKIGKASTTQYVLKSGFDYNKNGTFTIADLPKWAQDGTIAKGKTSGARARDYLLHGDLAENLAYSTPGVGGASTDTFVVKPESPIRFKRIVSTSAQPTLIRVPVYGAGARHYFTWAYGEINGRWGWIPLAALKIASGDSCSGKQDGFYCSERSPFSGFACEGQTVAYGHQCASDKQKCAGLNADKTAIVCK